MDQFKERHGCVGFWLWIIIIANSIFSLFFVFSMFDSDIAAQDEDIVELGVMTVSGLISILAAILLFRWSKKGFFLLIVSVLLIGINVAISTNVSLPSILLFGASVAIATLIWWGILHITKKGIPAWNLLENDWDYAHCRHLYQVFGSLIAVIVILVATLIGCRGGMYYHGDEEYIDSLAYEEIVELSDSIEEVEPEEPEWEVFYDEDSTCSVEAPSDFRRTKFNDDQLMALICSDFDPAVIVIRESVKELAGVAVRSTKDYANLIVKMVRNADGYSNFHKISEEAYGDDAYLIVFEIEMDEDKYQYNILTKKSETYFFYCQVFCLNNYAAQLQPIISHILSSFTI